MEADVIGGSLDGGLIPESVRSYFMLTRYDDENNPRSEVYWWQSDPGVWVFQVGATAEAMAGVVEQHTPAPTGD